MLLSFDQEKLLSLLQDFYTVTHIRITVFDTSRQEILSYPARRAVCCRVIRSSPEAEEQCKACDARAFEMASQKRDTVTYVCHAGLREAIMPIRVHDILIGYLMFGHIFSYDNREEGIEQILEKCGRYDINDNALRTALYEQPYIRNDYILAASHILNAVATYLSMEHMALFADTLPVQIESYIQSHLADDLSVPTICRQFQIGKTALYKLCQENYGTGVAEVIRKERMEAACRMLESNPDLKVSDVATRCGFSDYNYFITAFKKETGHTPKAYSQLKNR